MSIVLTSRLRQWSSLLLLLPTAHCPRKCSVLVVTILCLVFFFFFNDTATTEIYTLHIVGSVRCVQETDIQAYLIKWFRPLTRETVNFLFLLICFFAESVFRVYFNCIFTTNKEVLYAIIDIETTGQSAANGKITEIAIFIHDGFEITDSFSSLVNPECHIPGYITDLTGISNEMVRNAPKFYEIAPCTLR
eukprot:TRINITY_DN11493_c0_g1_i2.p2 TRINITY_DN11493_c0_g1~~TRINITY_DN11493_c0_g1_i2.p2  ORF type:complete len:191 (-),score=7.36 TRINITY_DN11493_c0_g1_i2:205-777(-)